MFVYQPIIGGTQALSNTLKLDINGFTKYSSAGALFDVWPQEALWNAFARIYSFYMIEHISFKYIPSRIQITGSTVGSVSVAQYPTVANTFPGDPTISPALNISSLQDIHVRLCARKKAKYVRGYDEVTERMSAANNELLRQTTPMLKTNGSAAARELYDDTKVSQLIVVPSCDPLGGTALAPALMGVVYLSVTTRFAGMINPTISVERPLSIQS